MNEKRNKMEQLQDKWEAAYFTVEASLIFPFVLLFTVMMIFLAFYSYDRCILEHSAYEAALRGTESHLDSAKEVQEVVQTAAGKLIEGKLFAIHDFHYRVEVKADEVIVSYHCEVNMPMLTWLSNYCSNIDFSLDISRSAKRCRPAKLIRDCRIINNLVSR